MQIYIDAVGLELTPRLQEVTNQVMWKAIAPFRKRVSWAAVQFVQDWTPDGRGGVFCQATLWMHPSGIVECCQYAPDVEAAIEVAAGRLTGKANAQGGMAQESAEAVDEPLPDFEPCMEVLDAAALEY